MVSTKLNLSRAFHRRVWTVRRKLWRVEWSRPRVHAVHGTPIIVMPNVFDGVLTRTGVFLIDTLQNMDLCGTRVLDLGCGSGLGAVFAARCGAHVIATDINPEAARNTQINALALHLENQVETRVGDLFETVPGERFDLILFNPPYYRGAPSDPADAAWRSPDAFDRFVRQLTDYLAPHGSARVVMSSDGNIDDALFHTHHLSTSIVRKRNFSNELLTVYELRAVLENVTA